MWKISNLIKTFSFLSSLLLLVIYNAVLYIWSTPPFFVLHVPFQWHLWFFNALIILGWEKMGVSIRKFWFFYCNRHREVLIVFVHHDLDSIPSNNYIWHLISVGWTERQLWIYRYRQSFFVNSLYIKLCDLNVSLF